MKKLRHLKRSKDLRPTHSDYTSGFGYCIIPNDIDRSVYMKRVYNTSECIILSTIDNTVIRNVRIPKGLIQELVFPLTDDVRGSLISWTRAEDNEQVFIDSIHFKSGETYLYGEDMYITKRSKDGRIITQLTNLEELSHLISVQGVDDEVGSLKLKALSPKAQCSITLNTDGKVDIQSDSEINLDVEELLTIKVGTEDAINTITLSKDGELVITDINENIVSVNKDGIVLSSNQPIHLKSDDVQLGTEAGESAVLGDVLTDLLKEFTDDIGAIGTIPTSTGITSTINTSPTWSALVTKWNTKFDTLKSKVVKVE